MEDHDTEEQNDYDTMTKLMDRSIDHAAAVGYIHRRSPIAEKGRAQVMTATAIAAAVALFLKEEVPLPIDIGSKITCIAGTTYLAFLALLKHTYAGHLRRLKEEHPLRLRKIFDEIRGRVSMLSDTAQKVEGEFFPPEETVEK